MTNDFSSFIEPDSIALYCAHSPFTSYLCSMLARSGLHRYQFALCNQTADVYKAGPKYWQLVYRYFDHGVFSRVNQDSMISHVQLLAFLNQVLGRPVYIYHSTWNSVARRICQRFPRGYRIIIEHGLDETFDYILECKQGYIYDNKVYLLTFYDQICSYLSRHHIEQSVQAYPLQPLVSKFLPTFAHQNSKNFRSLFLVSPIVEDGVMSDDDTRLVLYHFLERRQRTHYLIRLHPRRCEATTRIICEVLREFACSYELMPPSDDIAETAVVDYKCSEVCGFWSTSIFFLASLQGMAFDTAVPETLKYARTLRQFERDRLPILMDLFQLDKTLLSLRPEAGR